MLKGKTTIQLFNAETGVKEQEVVEENIVTKAVENILNPPIEYLESGTVPVSSTRRYSDNLVDSAYGGLLLFSNTHEETVDNTYPDYDSEIVGYGSDNTSYNTTKEGIRDPVETVWIDDDKGNHIGKRFVWNFAQSQGNGTISSVSLTSVIGGRLGGGDKTASGSITVQRDFNGNGIFNSGSYIDNNYLFYYPSNSASASLSMLNNLIHNVFNLPSNETGWDKINPIYISKLENDKFFILVSNMVSNNIVKIVFGSPRKISLFKNPIMDYPEYISHSIFISDIPNGKYGSIYVDDDEIHAITATSTSNQTDSHTHTIYNLETGEQKSSITIKTPVSVFAGTVGYLKNENYYICTNGTGYSLFYSNGEEIKNSSKGTYSGTTYRFYFSKDNNTGIYYFKIGSYMYPVTKNGLSPGGMGTGKDVSRMVIVKNDMLKSKGVCTIAYTTNEDTSTSKLLRGVAYVALPCYLGTINNLETPVVKTEAQTMKVTYELTESEE